MMSPRSLVATLAVCSVAVIAGIAADVHMGTWKLNETKSKLAAGMPKNHTVVYASVGDSMKITVDGTDGSGKPLHNEWTGKFDGKDRRDRRPHLRHAVVQEGGRSDTGVDRQEGRQDHPDRHHRLFAR